MDPTTILLGIIFIIVIGIFIAIFFFLNRDIPATAQVTDFGLTIQELASGTGLYMTLENILGTTADNYVFHIMSLKAVPLGQHPEPTEGWLLDRPSSDPFGTTVTFFNPTNNGFMTYNVDPTNTQLQPPYIRMDKAVIPSDPVTSNP